MKRGNPKYISGFDPLGEIEIGKYYIGFQAWAAVIYVWAEMFGCLLSRRNGYFGSYLTQMHRK
jgi:hypothetical protein